MPKRRLRVRAALSVPDLHRLKIAHQTLRYSDAGARIMGGMTKDEARQVIFELTGKRVRENPAGTPEEGPAEHLRNALAIIVAHGEGGLALQDVQAVAARIRAALQILEQRGHVYMGLPRRGNRRSVRRGNPALAVLGNPRVADATLATWAKIEYMRPDDPDGGDVVRVHEFRDGFEIAWLDDGSVQLSHPRHPLWTDDKE